MRRKMPVESEVLFTVFGLEVTPEVTTQWGIIIILAIISFFATRNIKDVPTGFQNVIETGLGMIQNIVSSVLGKERTRRFFPFFGTLFIFIIFSNLSGILPGAGSIRGFKAPTSSLSVTAGLAICECVAVQYMGFRTCGIKGHLKHFISPVVVMLPFLLIDEIVRPVSLALRLYGNIYGEESVTEQIYELLPIGAPLIMMILSLLFCTLQAIIFTTLTAIYTDEATALE